MDFQLSEEQRRLQETARKFAQTEMTAVARQLEADDVKAIK